MRQSSLNIDQLESGYENDQSSHAFYPYASDHEKAKKTSCLW